MSDLDRLIEMVRREQSNPSAYQHLLDSIAKDIEREFLPIKGAHEAAVIIPLVAEFVRKWRP